LPIFDRMLLPTDDERPPALLLLADFAPCRNVPFTVGLRAAFDTANRFDATFARGSALNLGAPLRFAAIGYLTLLGTKAG
jgi:hypothetical protein